MTSGPTALQVVSPSPPPDPEVSERAARRRFTVEYKLRMRGKPTLWHRL